MNLHIPNVVFTDFRISNKPVSLHDPTSVLKKEISYSDKLALKHDVKIISFEFAALDFFRSIPKPVRMYDGRL
ncbi:MAG: hypothetical protein IPJ40_03060 [Saprospirales bacterium]|nr:hypothetical protein [Saprospirales bacterium]